VPKQAEDFKRTPSHASCLDGHTYLPVPGADNTSPPLRFLSETKGASEAPIFKVKNGRASEFKGPTCTLRISRAGWVGISGGRKDTQIDCDVDSVRHLHSLEFIRLPF
jgi:hypothetical protein